LLAQRPGDEALQERLAEQEAHQTAHQAAAAGPTMREYLEHLSQRRPRDPGSLTPAAPVAAVESEMDLESSAPAAEAPVAAPEPVMVATPVSSAPIPAPAPDAFGWDGGEHTPVEAFIGVGTESEVIGAVVATAGAAMAGAAMAGAAMAGAAALSHSDSDEYAPNAELEAMFGAPTSAADEQAARAWASLYATPAAKSAEAVSTPAPAPAAEPAPPIAGEPTRPADRELSLSAVFRAPSTTPSAPRNSAAFSFDQFFAPAKDRASGSVPTAGDGDITEFNSWLEGLKKK
jgi:ribonuclease E